jgi:hypothetical protein
LRVLSWPRITACVLAPYEEECASRRLCPPNRLLHPARDLNAREVLATCGRCDYKHEWRYAIDDDPRIGFNEIAVSQNYDGLGFLPDGRLSGLNYHDSTQSQRPVACRGAYASTD